MSMCVILMHYPIASFPFTMLSPLMYYSNVPFHCLIPISQKSIPSQCTVPMTMYSTSQVFYPTVLAQDTCLPNIPIQCTFLMFYPQVPVQGFYLTSLFKFPPNVPFQYRVQCCIAIFLFYFLSFYLCFLSVGQ